MFLRFSRLRARMEKGIKQHQQLYQNPFQNRYTFHARKSDSENIERHPNTRSEREPKNKLKIMSKFDAKKDARAG